MEVESCLCASLRGESFISLCVRESGLCWGGREFSVKVCLCTFVCKELCEDLRVEV